MSSAAASRDVPTSHPVYGRNVAEVLPNTEPHQDVSEEESPIVMQTTTEGGEGSAEVAVASETLRAQLPMYSARPRHIYVQRNIIIGITLAVSVFVSYIIAY